MKTEMPVSTISYNTPEFLKATCDSLVKSGIIDWYAFIKHKGELDPFDSVRDKDHIHLLIRPLKAVEMSSLLRYFLELDPERPSEPLGCVRFDRCKSVGHWVLYSLHYSPYLDSLGETKEFTDYPFHDIITNNEQELRRARRSVPFEYKPKLNTVLALLNQGITRQEIKARVNPSPVQYRYLDDMIARELTGNERYTIIDNETGQRL